MRNLCLDAALDELASAGIREPVVAHGAKHPQLRWTTPRGELRVFAVPSTPSDWRSAENVRRDLRKISTWRWDARDARAATDAGEAAEPDRTA
jgi:hypothetical protein